MQRMMILFRVLLLLVLSSSMLLPRLPAHAQADAPASGSYEWLLVTQEKFDNPLYVTHAGDDSGRVFVVEQGGQVWIVRGVLVDPAPFLDISALLPDEVFRAGYTERGLLGLAFHPNYRKNGRLYVTYSRRDKINVLAEYRVSASDPDRADPASERVILTFDHPNMDHHGGMIAFGPDGYLYLSSGDGGGTQGDPEDDAQNKASLLGKLLRIDVDGDTRSVDGTDRTDGTGLPYLIPPDNPFVGDPTARPEVWAFGLRNPWRFSFDRETGDLYLGDVGWGRYEEINHVAAGTPGGLNFGWNRYEGNYRIEGLPDPGPVVMPVFQYDHSDGACSVTGGYVYRGPGAPTLRGVYVFGDYCSGRVWALWRDQGATWQSRVLMDTGMQISAFGEDAQGGLYLVNYKGYLYRLRER
jgi:glucose/arabinose dehydrogenase